LLKNSKELSKPTPIPPKQMYFKKPNKSTPHAKKKPAMKTKSHLKNNGFMMMTGHSLLMHSPMNKTKIIKFHALIARHAMTTPEMALSALSVNWPK
jgi:hypothetical protein